RPERFHFPGNFVQYTAQILLQQSVAQVDKANGLMASGWIEEGVLLLVTQHFQGGFTEDREIKRGFLRGGVGEDNLMRQRGLAGTRGARNDVEGKFRQPSAYDLIKAANAGRQLADFHFDRTTRGIWRHLAGRSFFLLFHGYSSFRESDSPSPK